MRLIVTFTASIQTVPLKSFGIYDNIYIRKGCKKTIKQNSAVREGSEFMKVGGESEKIRKDHKICLFNNSTKPTFEDMFEIEELRKEW